MPGRVGVYKSAENDDASTQMPQEKSRPITKSKVAASKTATRPTAKADTTLEPLGPPPTDESNPPTAKKTAKSTKSVRGRAKQKQENQQNRDIPVRRSRRLIDQDRIPEEELSPERRCVPRHREFVPGPPVLKGASKRRHSATESDGDMDSSAEMADSLLHGHSIGFYSAEDLRTLFGGDAITPPKDLKRTAMRTASGKKVVIWSDVLEW